MLFETKLSKIRNYHNNIWSNALLFEFKTTKNKDDDLKSLANETLAQINNQNYTANLQQSHIKQIIKIGLAFRGKEVAMAGSLEEVS